MRFLASLGRGAAYGFVWTLPRRLEYFILKPAAKEFQKTTNDQEVISVDDNSTSGEPAVEKHGGNSLSNISDRPSAVAWTKDDYIILSGHFEDEISFGEYDLTSFGGKDIFLTVASPELEYVGAWNAGGEYGGDRVNDVVIDSMNNIVITGSFGKMAFFDNQQFHALATEGFGEDDPWDFFIAKFSEAGVLQWLKHTGGNEIPVEQTGPNEGKSVTIDAFDNIIATGMYIGTPEIDGLTLPLGGPNEDSYLLKYSPDGKLIWGTAITGSHLLTAYDLATDDESNIYLTGYFGHFNLAGSAKFEDTILESYGGRDIFIAKYKPDGELAWAKQAGSDLYGGRDFGLGIATDRKGNCFVTGFYEGEALFDGQRIKNNGGRDIFIAKYSGDGNIQWVSQAGGQGNDVGNSLALDREGNCYLTGKFSGEVEFGNFTLSSRGEQDGFIAKYNVNGNVEWVRQIGGELDQVDTDATTDIAINERDEIVLVGFFSGTLHIGNKTLTSSGREDIFIVKLNTDGELVELKRMRFS